MSETAPHAPRQDALTDWLGDLPCGIGEILIDRGGAGDFVLCHRDDARRDDLAVWDTAEAANELARYDDAGIYRPLKTAPNLRHGWRLTLGDIAAVRLAIDFFYPARAAAYTAWSRGKLATTPFRDTLQRQTGIYRAASKITDEQANSLIHNFCRSGGGCLRTILWKRDTIGTSPSTLLPPEKFDPCPDQTGRGGRTMPLLCQEACTLLVAEARQVVKAAQ